MIEAALSVEVHDALTKHGFQTGQVLVGLGQLCPGVGEEVLQVRDAVPEVGNQGGTVLTATDPQDMASTDVRQSLVDPHARRVE